MDNIENLLVERGNKYGDYGDLAHVAQRLKQTITEQSPTLTDAEMESVDLICTKLARLAVGAPLQEDSWLDIAGYAKLAAHDVHGRLLDIGSEFDEAFSMPEPEQVRDPDTGLAGLTLGRGPRDAEEKDPEKQFSVRNNLRFIRRQRGFSQEDLGRMVGKAPSTISSYERGIVNPTVEIIDKLARHLEVPAEEIAWGYNL